MLSYISDTNAYLLYNCCKHSPPVNMLYNFISHLRSYYRWISVFDIYPPSPSFSYFYSCLYKVNDPGYNNSPVNMLYNFISHLRSHYRWISVFVIYPLSLSFSSIYFYSCLYKVNDPGYNNRYTIQRGRLQQTLLNRGILPTKISYTL